MTSYTNHNDYILRFVVALIMYITVISFDYSTTISVMASYSKQMVYNNPFHIYPLYLRCNDPLLHILYPLKYAAIVDSYYTLLSQPLVIGTYYLILTGRS